MIHKIECIALAHARAFASETCGAVFWFLEHMEGEGDGVDLVVVLAVGEGGDFVEEVWDPGRGGRRKDEG